MTVMPTTTARSTDALTADTSAPAETQANSSFSMSVGGGARDLTIAAAILSHDLGSEYLTLSAAIDIRWTLVRWRGLSAGVNVGPTRTLLLAHDYSALEMGGGVRGGGGLAYSRKAFSVFAEYYRGMIGFGDGPAKGTTMLGGLIVGLAFQP